MTDRITLTLWNPQQARQALATAWEQAKAWLMAGHRLTLEIKPERRSNEQNRRLWAMLSNVADQVEWHGQKLTAEDWKHIFSAALKKQRAVPGLDGGFVVLGQSTSRMTKSEMSDMQTLIEAFCAERGVTLNAPEEETK